MHAGSPSFEVTEYTAPVADAAARRRSARHGAEAGAVEEAVLGHGSTRSMGSELAPIRAGLSEEEQRWFDYVVVSEVEHWYPAHVDDLALATAYEGAMPRGGDSVPATGYAPIIADLADGLDIRGGVARPDERGVVLGDAVPPQPPVLRRACPPRSIRAASRGGAHTRCE